MPRYIRPRVAGATIFFTVTLSDRRSDLLLQEVAVLREAVRMTKAERPFRIDAWVVLPDHLHCIWTLPEGDADYSTRWGAIKARFSRCRAGFTPPHLAKDTPRLQAQSANGGVNPALRKGESGLWQRRFWEHHIRNDADYRAHLRYCWLNPLKHGYVEDPRDWPFSSLHREIRRGRIDPATLLAP